MPVRRTRRVSVEVIRRELSLSLTRHGAAYAHEPNGTPAEGGHPASTKPAPECSACRSRCFLFPAGNVEDSAIMQRVLEAHAIHNQLLPTGELLVCARSFELHAGTSEVTNPGDTTPSQSIKSTPEKSSSHD